MSQLDSDGQLFSQKDMATDIWVVVCSCICVYLHFCREMVLQVTLRFLSAHCLPVGLRLQKYRKQADG